MSTKKPNYIKTERLTLRPIEICDLQIIQNYSIDQEWHRFLDFHTKESVKEFVQKAVNSNWEEHARFSILIDNKMVGGVGLYIEMKNKTAEIGYSLSKDHWGMGIIPEAVTRVINYGFEDMKLEKIFAQTDLRNTPSQAVMKKMNMKKEGIFRKHIISQNKRRDVVFYSILKSEWEEKR
jgi:ribosomal-protein-alanine N-acetyltransferase